MTSNGLSIEQVQLPEDPRSAHLVAELAAVAQKQDKIAPLSEQFLRGLEDSRLGHVHFLARSEGVIVGCAAVGGDSAEMFIAPKYRGRGYGSALYETVSSVHPGVQVWAHGNLAPAQAIAAAHGLKVVRKLLVMEATESALAATMGEEGEEKGPLLASNFRQAVDKWGSEFVEKQWLKANNEAFSWHPEQGGWDRQRLHRAVEADWFDPEDVLFLWDEGQQGANLAGTKLAGFHWTKWHAEAAPAFGEVYVIGLADAYRGKGLGGRLLGLGLRHMVKKGAHSVILYVESDNKPALKVYSRLGFELAEEHCVWMKGD